MKLFKRLVFRNGLRVVLVPQKESVATTVLVMVEAGSKYETKEINGISHFLEHLCFKGTKNRPKAILISGELDGMGAEYNAFTGQEWTGYFAKVEAHKTSKALDLISDLYLNPVFDSGELEKEKGVVIEEINMYEDLPPRRVQELFTQLLYGDQPAGWDIAGKKEVIQRLTREEVVRYRSAHYVAEGTVIVVAGAFDEGKILKDIETHFVSIHDGKKFGKVATRERQAKPGILVKFKESDQTHLVVGCRAFSLFDKRRYALEVLSDILGGGMSSRLFQRVREELGAAYYVRASAELLSDHGFLAVAAGVDHRKFLVVLKAILEEMRRLAKEPVREEELRRAKDHLSGRLLLGLETSDALATFYGGQEVLREPIETPKDLLGKIERVTSRDVKAVAEFIMRNDKLNMALIGPYQSPKEVSSSLRFSRA